VHLLANTDLMVDQTVMHLYFGHRAIMEEVRDLVAKLRLCELEAGRIRKQIIEERLLKEQEQLLYEEEDDDITQTVIP
jgi:hypothetical protein